MILPTNEKQVQIKMMMEQSRWYYNFLVGVINSKYSKEYMLKKGSFYDILYILTSHIYKEEKKII